METRLRANRTSPAIWDRTVHWRFFNVMRYINLRFAYLITYSVTCHQTQVNAPHLNPPGWAVLNSPNPEGWKAELTFLLRLSSSRSVQNIGRWVVSIWHDRWQYLSRHSSQHPVCPNLLSGCLAMSSLVFRPSSCHLLVSILRPDRAMTSSFVTWSRHEMPRCSWGIGDGKHQSSS